MAITDLAYVGCIATVFRTIKGIGGTWLGSEALLWFTDVGWEMGKSYDLVVPMCFLFPPLSAAAAGTSGDH